MQVEGVSNEYDLVSGFKARIFDQVTILTNRRHMSPPTETSVITDLGFAETPCAETGTRSFRTSWVKVIP